MVTTRKHWLRKYAHTIYITIYVCHMIQWNENKIQDVDLGNQANYQMIMAGSGIFNLKQLHTDRTYRTTYVFDPNFSVMLVVWLSYPWYFDRWDGSAEHLRADDVKTGHSASDSGWLNFGILGSWRLNL